MLRIAIFGMGYVGCVSAARLAETGHTVVGVDTNPQKVSMINARTSPVVEPGLDALIADVVASGRLRATDSCADAIAGTDLALVCVGTPGYSSGQQNVDTLIRVGREIGAALRQAARPYTIVLRSTVLPGTTKGVFVPAILAGRGNRHRPALKVAVNPEFMREGSALRDFLQPPFTLAGCDDDETAALLREMYRNISAPFVQTPIMTAEMVKYVGNAYHALKVCFANEIGDACMALGADPQEVMRVFRMDRKLNISDAYLRPGFAFGGSCLPKDLRAVLYAAQRADVPLPLLNSILPSNEGQIRRAIDAVLETGKRRIGVVGLAFKPGTDDMRESPMVTLVEALIGKGCDVRILDGNVSLANLVGANRSYLAAEIPHIAALICTRAEELTNHAEVIVLGNAGPEATNVLSCVTPAHRVIDLTRGTVRAGWREPMRASG